jgi:molybdenum cofactor cytidylyltransferase
LKNIPASATKILLINQIDSFPNWKAFHSFLDTLLTQYHGVGFSVLEDQMLLEYHERIAGIVLAAGGSTRFGEPKQLLDWYGVPLVRFIADLVREGGCDPILVITGSDHDSISPVLTDGQVEVICNTGWQSGQSSSVRSGINALPEHIGGVIFTLVDQPCIPPDLFQVLKMKHARTQASIILPQVDGKNGNPVLFDQRVFEELTQLEGDAGGRMLFERYPPVTVEWDDPASQMDIDTPDDYQKIRFSENCSD